MDVDYTQMSPDKREQLMKSGSCFWCEKQGHLSKDCSTKKKASIREATVKTAQKGKEDNSEKKDDPLSYDSLLKQINACSMEDRQKILEVFSQDGSEPEDFWKAQFAWSWCEPTMYLAEKNKQYMQIFLYKPLNKRPTNRDSLIAELSTTSSTYELSSV
jgi:hypothetical protein